MVAPRSHSARRRRAPAGPRPMWRGAVTFGLVTIPVALHLAVKREELKFRLLRQSDLSPVNYKRVAETDGKEVPWNEIVKGYEYEKGRYVVLRDTDFKRVDLEATDTIEIIDFVTLQEVNPIHFMRPYYLQPLKGGAKPYALLREVLHRTGKAGIAKVVIRTRQHLAAVKVNGDALVLELMHFADDLVDPRHLDLPGQGPVGRRELAMATSLVEQMTTRWDPDRYNDDYTSAMLKLIQQKIASGGRLPAGKPRPRAGTDVADLMAALKKSLDRATRPPAARAGRATRPARAARSTRRAVRRTAKSA